MRPRISQIALIAALTAGAARAQEAEEAIDLGTITLSALRDAAEALRTGVSVTVVGREDLAQSGATRLADHLARLPGVSVVTQGGFGATTQMRIRGFDGRHIAVFVDGIRIDDPSGVQVSTDFGALMTADIARIEVLRGTQSALWGGSAVAGVISITTLDGAEEGLHQRAEIAGGSYGSVRLSYGLTQKDERLELALNASHFRTDGFSSFDGGTEADGAEASRLSLAARYRVGDALTLGGAAFLQRSRNDFDGYIDTDADGYTDTFTDMANDQTRHETGARLFAEIDSGAVQHELGLSFFRSKRELNDESGLSHFTGERLSFDAKGRAELSPVLTLLYGADWSRERAKTTAQPGGSGDTDIAGIWGQAVWSPRDDLDLIAALRHDEHSAFGGFGSGRLSVAWRATDDLVLRGAVARGFRAPSLDELYGDYPAFWFTGNPDLQPETSLSWELGADYAAGEGLTLSATAFRIEVEDRIAADPATFWSTLGNLEGTSVSKGLELSAGAALSERIGLVVAYTYTDARDPNGARMIRVPRHSLSLTLAAELSDRLSAQASLQHLGGRLDNDVNTFSPLALPDVTLLGLGLDYALSESVTASLRVENLADRDWQSSHGYGAPGRSVWLGLGARF